MPTYEYKCKRCSKVIKKFQSMTEPPLKTCPSCRGSLKRLISAGGGILFKGSGFYQTDYRSERYKKKEKEEKGVKAKPTQCEASKGCSTVK